jgi:hypothetical protein
MHVPRLENRSAWAVASSPKADATMSEETKVCTRCEKPLPIAEFGIDRSKRDGRNVACRSCLAAKWSDPAHVAAKKAYDAGRYAERRDEIERILQNFSLVAHAPDKVRAALEEVDSSARLPLAALGRLSTAAKRGNAEQRALAESFLALYPVDRWRVMRLVIADGRDYITAADIKARAPRPLEVAEQQ